MNYDDNLNTQENKIESKELEFQKKLKKIFKILTIIILTIGSSLAFTAFFSFNIIGATSIQPLLNLLAFSSALGFIILTTLVILVIWLLYGMIIFLHKSLYIKFNTKNKKLFKIILLLLSAVLILSIVLINDYKNDNKNISKVLTTKPSGYQYDNSAYYFIYNNKIYYYRIENKLVNGELRDKLFVMNLDGTENKLLAETIELRYPYFYFVYKNEAYYYSEYYSENKKINLSTGEITSLGSKDAYVNEPSKDGTIITIAPNYISRDISTYTNRSDNIILKKINLNTGNVLKEVHIKNNISSDNYYLDYEYGNIYYIDVDTSTQNKIIYKNSLQIYQLPNSQSIDITLLAATNKYLYFKSEGHIYKLNNFKKTIEEIEYDLGDIHRINNKGNYDNYFYSDKKIYKLDLTTDKFILTLNNIEEEPQHIYSIDNKLVLMYNRSILSAVTIYDVNTKTEKKYINVSKTSFDDNCIYLLTGDKNSMTIEKYKLN